jgi:hypothetical protein
VQVHLLKFLSNWVTLSVTITHAGFVVLKGPEHRLVTGKKRLGGWGVVEGMGLNRLVSSQPRMKPCLSQRLAAVGTRIKQTTDK